MVPRLGRAGIPSVGMGTWQLQGRTCVERVRDGLEMGYRHIDTAEMYDNEEQVGEGIRTSGVAREEVFLTTKVWYEHLSPSGVKRAAEASLGRLGCEYVDLLLIHWPSSEVPLEDTLDAMTRLCGERKVRFLGVSNFPSPLWERALAAAPVVCNQVEYHLFLAQERLWREAREHGQTLVAYSPLAQGRVLRDPVVRQIADRHDRTPAQVALRWLVQQDHVAAIPKAAGRRHLEDNLNLFDFELSPAEMNRLRALARGQRLIDPPWAPDWSR